jgi:hypothetical protein
MTKYKLIQLTNNNIQAVAADSFIPLGTVTRKINSPSGACSTFTVNSSSIDSVSINEPGYYKITYSATLTAGAAGTMTVTLVNNSTDVYTVGEEATAAEDIVDLTLIYVIRIYPNCCASNTNYPAAIQFRLGDTAAGITPNPSTANLVIEKIY